MSCGCIKCLFELGSGANGGLHGTVVTMANAAGDPVLVGAVYDPATGTYTYTLQPNGATVVVGTDVFPVIPSGGGGGGGPEEDGTVIQVVDAAGDPIFVEVLYDELTEQYTYTAPGSAVPLTPGTDFFPTPLPVGGGGQTLPVGPNCNDDDALLTFDVCTRDAIVDADTNNTNALAIVDQSVQDVETAIDLTTDAITTADTNNTDALAVVDQSVSDVELAVTALVSPVTPICYSWDDGAGNTGEFIGYAQVDSTGLFVNYVAVSGAIAPAGVDAIPCPTPLQPILQKEDYCYDILGDQSLYEMGTELNLLSPDDLSVLFTRTIDKVGSPMAATAIKSEDTCNCPCPCEEPAAPEPLAEARIAAGLLDSNNGQVVITTTNTLIAGGAPVATGECGKIDVYTRAPGGSRSLYETITGTTGDVVGNYTTTATAGTSITDFIGNTDVMLDDAGGSAFTLNKRDWATAAGFLGATAVELEFDVFVGGTDCGPGGVLATQSVNTDNTEEVCFIKHFIFENDNVVGNVNNGATLPNAATTLATFDPLANVTVAPIGAVNGTILEFNGQSIQGGANVTAAHFGVYLNSLCPAEGGTIRPADSTNTTFVSNVTVDGVAQAVNGPLVTGGNAEIIGSELATGLAATGLFPDLDVATQGATSPIIGEFENCARRVDAFNLVRYCSRDASNLPVGDLEQFRIERTSAPSDYMVFSLERYDALDFQEN